MNEIQYNLKNEKKLVELLGYNLIGPDNSNRWSIVDENNIQVGFIQYKKLFNKNSKKGIPVTFGYCGTIDSSDISCKFTRKLKDNCSETLDDYFTYEFEVKRENGNTDTVEICMGEYPRINMWSKEYGFTDFYVNYEGLYLNFKSKTENFNTEETIVFKPNKEYTYQISYCKKEFNLDSEKESGITTRIIRGIYEPYFQEPNKLNLIETTWINGKLRTNRKNEVIGTVEEMAMKHQMGVEAFNHFRYLINQILPVKKDIISTVLNDEIVKEYGLSLFISDLEKENIKLKQMHK